MRDMSTNSRVDLVCYSHFRWESTYQRPQHLMSRFARERRVFYIEEPRFDDGLVPKWGSRESDPSGVRVFFPVLSQDLKESDAKTTSARNKTISRMLKALFREQGIAEHISWFYTPTALEQCPGIQPVATIYDCIDEPSSCRSSSPTHYLTEKELFRRCDMVFTGGASLFEAKRRQHTHVYPFPSSVDVPHFARARSRGDIAPDQNTLSRPRLGYAGTIDERIDLELLREVAELRPEWQFIMVGPVAKVDESTLPRAANIHWLGEKTYGDLPTYFAGWDVAMMPFVINDSTRYMSPTKTPEFLAAGLPVVSTPVRDVARSYGKSGLVRIASNAQAFVAEAEQSLTHSPSLKVRRQTDAYLRTLSWEATWSGMNLLIEQLLKSKYDAKDEQPPLTERHQALAASL